MPSYQKLVKGALEKIAKRQAEMDAMQAEIAARAALEAQAKATFADPKVAPKGPLTLFHGSPHKFEEFDFENNLLRGEGALAFGPGGYMTGHEPLARAYARDLYQRHAAGNAWPPRLPPSPGGAHPGIVEAALKDKKATAEFLRAKTVADLMPYQDRLRGELWTITTPNPRAPAARGALTAGMAKGSTYFSGNTRPAEMLTHVVRDAPDMQAYFNIAGDSLQGARVGKGGYTPDEVVRIGRELRALFDREGPELRPRVTERNTYDPSAGYGGPGSLWIESSPLRKQLERRNALLPEAVRLESMYVPGFNARRQNLNSTARVVEGRPGNAGYTASMQPGGSGRVDLRNPQAPYTMDMFQGPPPPQRYARRLYSAPFEAGFDEMLPYDFPIENVTPKLMGALTQLAAQHGDLGLLRGRMTGEEFVNNLRGAPIDKMRALRDAGVPATFYLRGGRRNGLPDVLDPADFNFVIHDQTRLGPPKYEEFARGGNVA